MAPGQQQQHQQHQQKRKRGDRNYSSDNVDRARPSPHRPENLSLAQQNGVNGRGGGGRRTGRGGRGGASASAIPAPVHNSAFTSTPLAQVASPTPAAQSRVAMPSPAPMQPLAAMPSQPTHARSAASVPLVQFPSAGSSPHDETSDYVYAYCTAVRRMNWHESGRQALIQDVLSRAEAEEFQELGIFFQEVVHVLTQALINPGDAGALIKEIIDTAPNAEELDLRSLFLDTVAVVLTPQYPTGKEETGKELGINQFLASTGIDKKLICTLLDEKLLMALKIVRGTFDRMGIRHSTNVLYRQSGFNLLREESEGYSKLMTEFFTVTHNFKPDRETVEQTWEKVKALIGAFDLDVGRVLDLTLDAFANNLIKHNKFFIRLLKFSDFWPKSAPVRASPDQSFALSSLPLWADTNYGLEVSPEDSERNSTLRRERDRAFWDRAKTIGIQAFFELDGRQVSGKQNKPDSAALHGMGELSDGQEINGEPKGLASLNSTGTSHGNSIAAQILGFKVRYYASEARDPTEKLSENVIWLSALLIKIGFVTLKDMYPHFYPTDDKMEELRQRLVEAKQERQAKLRPGASSNALTAAGALSEGEPTHSLPVSRSLQETKTGARTPLRTVDNAGVTSAGLSTPSQNTEVVKPEFPEPEDQKIVLIKSLLLVGAIPDALYILGKYPWLLDLHDELPKYVHRLIHHMISQLYAETQVLRGRTSDVVPGKGHVEHNNGPAVEARQPAKSIAWGRFEKTEWSEGDYGTSYRFYWDDWCDLVPVCQSVDDMFVLCNTFLNLTGVKIGRDSELLAKIIRIGVKSLKDDSTEENSNRWKDLTKRLLIPSLSLTKADPGVVNEAWQLVKHLPTATRYAIYSEWFSGSAARLPDVMTESSLALHATVNVLKRISKTNIRDMARMLAKVAYSSPAIAMQKSLKSIESYNNLIDTLIECLRYFTHIGFDVLVWQILDALSGEGRDRMQADGMMMSKWLQRLAEFAGKACKRYYKEIDIKPILLYIKDKLKSGDSAGLGVLGQIISSMGGIQSDQNWSEEQVIALAGRPTLRSVILKRVLDRRHEVKRESARLVQALTTTNLAGDFLVLIARERQQYLERPSSSGAPIKVLSTNLTNLQGAFVQYLEFLRSNYSISDFDAVVPPLEELIGRYHIEPAIAFAIARPSIQHRIDEANETQESNKLTQRSLTNGDAETKDSVAAKSWPVAEPVTEKEAEGGTRSDEASMAGEPQTATPAATAHDAASPWHPVLQSVIDRLKGVLEPGFEDKISMLFYLRFWQSNLGDLVAGQYDEEVKNARLARNEVNNDRSDVSPKAQKDKAAKRAYLNQLDKDLQDEWRMAIAHKNAMARTFTNERASWFPAETFGPKTHADLADAIVQECILPRITLSEMDALFTAKFLLMVHKMSTPGFRTAKILARMFNEQQFIATLFMLTEREARNLGIFMKEILAQLKIWRDNKDTYEKQGAGPNNENPGFARALREDNTVDGKNPTCAPLDHIDFQRLLFKWHNMLCNAVVHCLSSKEFMHVRNAIFFVKQVHEFFPVVTFHGAKILEQVQKLTKEEDRDDLKLSATSVQVDLQKMRSKWVLPQNFRQGDGLVSGRAGISRAGTPKLALVVGAKEFTPKTPSSSAKEEEDGEIEEEKLTAVAVSKEIATGDDSKREALERSKRSTSGPGSSKPSPPPVQNEPEISSLAVPSSASTERQAIMRTSASNGPLLSLPGGLPARPQGPIPPHRDLHRRPEADRTPSRQEGRSEESHGRLDRPERPVDSARDPLRRRSKSPAYRSRNRSPDQRFPRIEDDRRVVATSSSNSNPSREATDSRASRDNRLPKDLREERHRNEHDPRKHEAEAGWLPQPNDVRDRGLRQSNVPARSMVPSIDPGRAALICDSGMNPERAALLARDNDRRPDDDRRHTRGKRGQSPPQEARIEPRIQATGSRGNSPRRGERAGPERPPPRSGPRDRKDEPASTPSGPVVELHRGRNELFPPSSRSAPTEPSHGRLNHPDNRAQQDLNYGRLNVPDAAPSGPRNRGAQARGGRTIQETAPSGPRAISSSSPANLPPSSPNHDRGPPAGPAADAWRNGSLSSSNAPASAPQGPAASVNIASIHPSRMQNIPQPPPVQTNMHTTPSGHSAIPSGPRSGGHRPAPSLSNMSAPSPTGRFPPTGPASSGGSLRGGRSTIGLINGVLQDQQPQRNTGVQIRGRGSIGGGSQQGSAPQSPIISTSPSMAAQPSMLPPGPPVRPEPPVDRLERLNEQDSTDQRGSRRSSGGSPRDESIGGRKRHGRSRSRSPRREAADNVMRQGGGLPPRSGLIRDEGGRRRESSDREIERRNRDSDSSGQGRRESERDRFRDNQDPRASSRNENRPQISMPGHQPNPFMGGSPPSSHQHNGSNSDMRGGRGPRRDDRDQRSEGGRGGGTRDVTKRRSDGPLGGASAPDYKRPRRGGQ